MLQVNYEKYVEALWDPVLKETLHEMYYDLVPELSRFVSGGLGDVEPIKALGAKIKTTMIETMARYIIDTQDPYPLELEEFITSHLRLIAFRIDEIMDQEEMKIQIKRRGLIR